MSDDDLRFELEPFDNQAQSGLSGTVDGYGQVRVFHVKPVRPPQPQDVFRTELVGEHLPEAYLAAKGLGGQPSLGKSAVLGVDGVTGTLSHNALGVRRASRAVRIGLGDRAYTYAATPGFSNRVELRRDGARVSFANGKLVPGLGARRLGAAHGAVDAVDLAIALVLEGVDVSSLTLAGTLAHAPFRLLNLPDGGGE